MGTNHCMELHEMLALDIGQRVLGSSLLVSLSLSLSLCHPKPVQDLFSPLSRISLSLYCVVLRPAP